MLNNVSLMGRLTRDPELRHTQNGTPVAGFSPAAPPPEFTPDFGVEDDGELPF